MTPSPMNTVLEVGWVASKIIFLNEHHVDHDNSQNKYCWTRSLMKHIGYRLDRVDTIHDAMD